MSFITKTVGNVLGDLTGANAAAKGQQQAAATQAAASQAGIDETRRQFDALQKALQPYSQTGGSALSALSNLLGLGGADAQQQAISGIANSSEYKTALDQGQNAILQNASATGGLRGGNTQAALAQFAPQLLNQLVNQKYSQLGGLVSVGQNAAAGVGNAGMQSAGSIAQLLQQQGAAKAGGQIAAGNSQANNIGSATGLLLNGLSKFLGFSDRRLKTNIVHIGMTERGNRKYRWDWISGGSGEGVMADEVRHIPGAVHQHESGYLMVDYSKV